MGKPIYSQAKLRPKKALVQPLNQNGSPQRYSTKAPQMSAAQLLAIANNGVWKP